MRVIAIGGGGFMMGSENSPVDQYLAEAPAKPRPKICFISTASGDRVDHIDLFYEAFSRLQCCCSHLAFFRKSREGSLSLREFDRQLAEQDLIFVGGGNTFSMLAVWEMWGLGKALRRIGNNGTILSGMSAGAICWFDWGISDSFGDDLLRPVEGLGLIKGICTAHFNGDPRKDEILRDSLEHGISDVGYAIDDDALLDFNNGWVTLRSFSPRAQAHIYRNDVKTQHGTSVVRLKVNVREAM